MIVTALIVGILWGVYGLIAGAFIGSKSCLNILGFVMVLIYVIICIKALLGLDWTLIIGVPCFLAGCKTGESMTSNKQA